MLWVERRHTPPLKKGLELSFRSVLWARVLIQRQCHPQLGACGGWECRAEPASAWARAAHRLPSEDRVREGPCTPSLCHPPRSRGHHNPATCSQTPGQPRPTCSSIKGTPLSSEGFLLDEAGVVEMGPLAPPALDRGLSQPPEQIPCRSRLISLETRKGAVASGAFQARVEKGPAQKPPSGPTQHLLGRPLFNIYCVPRRAVGRALGLDGPAPALGLEASGSASQGLGCRVCEMERKPPPGWAVARRR